MTGKSSISKIICGLCGTPCVSFSCRGCNNNSNFICGNEPLSEAAKKAPAKSKPMSKEEAIAASGVPAAEFVRQGASTEKKKRGNW